MQKYGLVSLGLIIVFLATAHTFNYEESISNDYNDIKTYYFMSTNGFVEGAGEIYPSHHLERWPIHLAVGSISNFFSLNVWKVYRISIIILGLISFFAIKSLKTTDLNKIAIFSLIIFNPYSFRLFYAAPGMISDLGIYVAFLIIICGILNKSNTQIIGGIFLSVISRQTSIMLVPILILLTYFDYISYKNCIKYIFLIIVGFILIKIITANQYGPMDTGYFLKHAMGLINWIIYNFSFKDIFPFVGRYILFLLTLSGFLLIFPTNKVHVSYLFLSLFFFIHLQPIMAGPGPYMSGNMQRLCALGIPFLIPLITNSKVNKRLINYFIISNIVVSFHHHSSLIYYINYGKIIFLFLILASSVVCFSILWKQLLINKKD